MSTFKKYIHIHIFIHVLLIICSVNIAFMSLYRYSHINPVRALNTKAKHRKACSKKIQKLLFVSMLERNSIEGHRGRSMDHGRTFKQFNFKLNGTEARK